MRTVRWRGGGQDRLYVKDDDGINAGWCDLVGQQVHPEDEDKELLLRVALLQWNREQATAAGPDH